MGSCQVSSVADALENAQCRSTAPLREASYRWKLESQMGSCRVSCVAWSGKLKCVAKLAALRRAHGRPRSGGPQTTCWFTRMGGLWRHPAYSCRRASEQLNPRKPPGDGDVRSKGCRQWLHPQSQRPFSCQRPSRHIAKVRQRDLVGRDGQDAAFCGRRRPACLTCSRIVQLKNSLVGTARGRYTKLEGLSHCSSIFQSNLDFNGFLGGFY